MCCWRKKEGKKKSPTAVVGCEEGSSVGFSIISLCNYFSVDLRWSSIYVCRQTGFLGAKISLHRIIRTVPSVNNGKLTVAYCNPNWNPFKMCIVDSGFCLVEILILGEVALFWQHFCPKSWTLKEARQPRCLLTCQCLGSLNEGQCLVSWSWSVSLSQKFHSLPAWCKRKQAVLYCTLLLAHSCCAPLVGQPFDQSHMEREKENCMDVFVTWKTDNN